MRLKKGVDQRSEVIGMLSSEVFAMSTSDEMGNYLTELEDLIREDKLSETTKKMVEECRKEYDRNKKIPQAEYEAYVKLEAKAESVWEEAREKSDFEMFRPYLEQIVEFKKKFITYWGYETYKYNTLLDMYEPGITVEVLDHVFGQLRERIVPLVKEISDSQKRLKTSALSEHFSKENKNFTLELLKQLNYDFEAGRLDETVHPFEITLNRGMFVLRHAMTKKISVWLCLAQFMNVVMLYMNKILQRNLKVHRYVVEHLWVFMSHNHYSLRTLSVVINHSGRKIMIY